MRSDLMSSDPIRDGASNEIRLAVLEKHHARLEPGLGVTVGVLVPVLGIEQVEALEREHAAFPDLKQARQPPRIECGAGALAQQREIEAIERYWLPTQRIHRAGYKEKDELWARRGTLSSADLIAELSHCG